MTTDTAAVVPADDTAALALRPGQSMWDARQKAALVAMGVSPDATNADLAVFAHVCQRTQLDPFTRQIYMISRRTKERWQDDRGQWQETWVTKQTIQVGIDGFRVIRERVAERTGCQVEFEDTVWYDKEGSTYLVWLFPEAPTACRVVLVKHQQGRVLRFPAVLRTASYMQVNGKGEPVSQWRTQPEHMIEKCCEAFATRRAFPHDFSGVYIEEEMSREDRNGAMVTGLRGAKVLADHRKVTVAEIRRDEDRQPEPGPEPEPPAVPEPKAERKPQPAAKAALERLNDLAASLELGTDEDVLACFEWLGGTPWTATAGQVRTVTSSLNSFIEAAGGDLAAARDAVWLQYGTVHGGESGG
jgi:phage recombination protein Bet